MRNLLALLAAVVLVFAGVGWYRGWYRVQSNAAPPGHHAVNIDIDKDKIGRDLHDGEAELQKVLDSKLSAKDANQAEKAPADAAAPNLKQKPPADSKIPPPRK